MTKRLMRLSTAAVVAGLSLGLFASWMTREQAPQEITAAPVLTSDPSFKATSSGLLTEDAPEGAKDYDHVELPPDPDATPKPEPTEDPDPDTDGDGLRDSEEAQLGTDTGDEDTDDDHYSDYVEANAGTDPLDPADYPDDGPNDDLLMAP